ncbi:zinc-binding alcohol dehydrogenase family protein [Pseudoduganella umbonata]|uniref:2-desacetyl-2-hydroxyethyl bacteriochlorophyllide A dehydrogenase n=1 Tax=Pseudoduganella umbonata TaxID=864828 RepID=A0A4P8HYN1_9BURK|nr:zinc-binding alcohol dehydrogenase family protein [Pseudoduganella umbonata]MBB3224002.1 2-desacetyl-2-hydroxyethyl bacteriochlorophyllide A dehydrogenase [Pseudoduganella umbonata]QCP14122.1 zinc-binding alcohol dehydrogenase family protein [Pseudoduganella umbonata]
MKAVVCESPGELRLVERPMPQPGAGDVLLRIRRIGLCGTDMHIFRGTQPYLSYPRVMGHELSGEVVTAPAGSGLQPGDAVYVMPYLSCGHCVACRKGRTNCCTRIEVLGVHRDGGMAEYLALPAQFVFRTDGISLDDAAMLEFLAIGAHAVQRGAVEAGQNVLVAGAGPIGVAVALFAGLRGATVTVLDTREDRLAFCRTALDIERTVTVGEGDKAALAALTDGEFFDAVFDATGNVQAMERGLEFVAHGGTYVLVSIVRDRISFDDPEFHKRETTLLGSRNATAGDFRTVLAAMKAGRVPTALMNTHRATLAGFVDVLPRWMDPAAGVIKAIVEV